MEQIKEYMLLTQEQRDELKVQKEELADQKKDLESKQADLQCNGGGKRPADRGTCRSKSAEAEDLIAGE